MWKEYCKEFFWAFLKWGLPCLAAGIFMIFFVTDHREQVERANVPEEIYFRKMTGNLGQPLQKSLQEDGLSKDEAHTIVNKLDTVLNMRRVSKYDKYLLTLDENDNFKMLVVTKDFSRYFVTSVGGELVAGILDITVESRRRQAVGEISDFLFNSMQAQGLKPGFILDFTDVFSWAIDFNTETRVGDKFAVIWDEDYTKTGQTLNENIVAAYYGGEATGKNYAFRFEDEYYDETGKFTKKMFLKAPISVRGVRISSRFSKGRMHPILRIRRPHLGIDYAAPVGTPVETVADGVVKFKGWKGGFGNYLEIAHPNNYNTCYGHLKSYAKGINVGTKVKQGQTIAYVGSTGLSTGPHLDFRIRQGNKYFDFLNSKQRSSAAREIPEQKREEFNKIKEEYKALLDKILENK